MKTSTSARGKKWGTKKEKTLGGVAVPLQQLWACRDDFCQFKLTMKPSLCSRQPLCASTSLVDTWANWALAQHSNVSTEIYKYSRHYLHFCPSSSQGFLLPEVRKMSCSSPSNKPRRTYSDFAVGRQIVECMYYSLRGFCFSFFSTSLHYLLPIFCIYLFHGCEYKKCRRIRIK